MSLKRFFRKYRIYHNGSSHCPYSVEKYYGLLLGWGSIASSFGDIEEAEEYIESRKELEARKGVVKYV